MLHGDGEAAKTNIFGSTQLYLIQLCELQETGTSPAILKATLWWNESDLPTSIKSLLD